MDTIETRTVKRNNRFFNVSILQSYDIPEPWLWNDGHGVVEWIDRPKHPHERILMTIGKNRHLVYDIAASTAKAKTEYWGIVDTIGKTQKECVAKAVMSDFEHLRAFCNGDWYYVDLVVFEVNAQGWQISEPENLGGVEYWVFDGEENNHVWNDVVNELINQIAE